MSQRTLEITEISAIDLNKVNLITKMHVYALVSISGDKSKQQTQTPVDKDGGRKPSWNFTMKFTLDEAAVQENHLTLVLKLMSERVLGDKEIGEVRVPIKELLDSHESGNVKQLRSYQVRKPDGRPKGSISFSYQFAGKDTNVDEPVMALPPHDVVGKSSQPPPEAVASGTSTPPSAEPVLAYPPSNVVGTSSYPPPAVAYPPSDVVDASPYPPPTAVAYACPPATNKEGVVYAPPQQATHGEPVAGYPPPPQYAYPQQQVYGYGYAPQRGYGNAPVVQQPKTSSKLGMGLGVGLLGGVVGGMVLDDMISDAADYDDGFCNDDRYCGDDGDFDF